MINLVHTGIPQADGSTRYVIIEPILKKEGDQELRPTGVFKIHKDAFGDETHLFTDPSQSNAPADDLPDEQNPDYLGKIVFGGDGVKHFEGAVLSLAEQAYLAVFIESYR